MRRVSDGKGLNVQDIDGKKVFEWAQNGDRVCLEAIDEMLDALAQGVLMTACVVNPEAFVIGGGISAQKDFLEPRLREKLSGIMLPHVLETTRVSFAELGNNAGMLGALRCILNNESV